MAEEKQVVKFSVVEADIARMKGIYMDLKVSGPDDDEGFEAVDSARKVVKKKRVAVDNEEKDLKSEANKWRTKVGSRAKEIRKLIEPIESHLVAQCKIVTDEKERVKVAEEKALQEKIDKRMDTLAGYLRPLPYQEASAMSDEDYETHLEKAMESWEHDQEMERKAAEKQKAEAEHLEKDRLEFEEKQRAEQAERDKIAKEQKAEAKRLENERAELVRAESERRKNALSDIGIAVDEFSKKLIFIEDDWDFTLENYEFSKFDWPSLLSKPSGEFGTIVVSLKDVIQHELEKSKERKEEEAELAEKEKERLAKEAEEKAERLKPDIEKVTEFLDLFPPPIPKISDIDIRNLLNSFIGHTQDRIDRLKILMGSK